MQAQNSDLMIGVFVTLWILKEAAKVIKPFVIKKETSALDKLAEIFTKGFTQIDKSLTHIDTGLNQANTRGDKDHDRLGKIHAAIMGTSQETSAENQEIIKTIDKIKIDTEFIKARVITT